MVYALNGPLHFWNGFHTGVQADRLKQQLDLVSTAEAEGD